MDYKQGEHYRIQLPKDVNYFPCIPNPSAKTKHNTLELHNGDLVTITKANHSITECSESLIITSSDKEFVISTGCADAYFIPIFKRKKK